MAFDDIVQYRSVWNCFPAQVYQLVEPMVRSAIQRRAERASAQAMFSSRLLRAQTHPAVGGSGRSALNAVALNSEGSQLPQQG